MSYVHNIIIYMIFVYTIYICYRLYCSMLQINHMIQKRSREYSRESLNVRPNSSEVYNWWDNLTQLSSCRSPAAQHLGFDSYGDLVPSEFMVSTPLIRGTSDDPGLFNKSLQCFMFNKKNTLFAQILAKHLLKIRGKAWMIDFTGSLMFVVHHPWTIWDTWDTALETITEVDKRATKSLVSKKKRCSSHHKLFLLIFLSSHHGSMMWNHNLWERFNGFNPTKPDLQTSLAHTLRQWC